MKRGLKPRVSQLAGEIQNNRLNNEKHLSPFALCVCKNFVYCSCRLLDKSCDFSSQRRHVVSGESVLFRENANVQKRNESTFSLVNSQQNNWELTQQQDASETETQAISKTITAHPAAKSARHSAKLLIVPLPNKCARNEPKMAIATLTHILHRRHERKV